MTTRILPAALAFAAALVLTSCGSSGGKGSDKINGAQNGSTSTSPSASDTSGMQPPTITVPADLHLVFDWNQTGDAQKDAVIRDTEQYFRAFNQAMAKQNPSDPAYQFYSEGAAAEYAHNQTQEMVKGGWAPTGTDRFYRAQVAVSNDGAAGITFCEDQSQNFGKSVKSGQIDRTQPSDADYYFYNIGLVKDSAEGVWKANQISVRGKAVECKG